jgi:hypothetical protein
MLGIWIEPQTDEIYTSDDNLLLDIKVGDQCNEEFYLHLKRLNLFQRLAVHSRIEDTKQY